MRYKQIPPPHPAPFFELQVKTNLERCVATVLPVFPPPHLMRAIAFYISAMLLAENAAPHPHVIITCLEKFSRMLPQAGAGRPILHLQGNTLALTFDAFSVQSEMNVESPDELTLAYTQTMMGFLLFKRHPAAIGMIGLGGGSLVKFCHRHLPGAAISVAEIDPQVIALRQSFLIPDDSERLQVMCMDGAEFVRRAGASLDVLLVDGFDNNGQPAQLCSQQFYDDCYASLTPDGLMVVNLLGGNIWETDGYLNRMRHSFGGAVIAANSPDSFNIIVFAWKDQALSLDRETLSARMPALTMLHPAILKATVQSLLSGKQAIARRRAASAQSLPCGQALQHEG